MPKRAYGWTADSTALVPNEARELRRIVREIDPARKNPKSLRQVVRELNDRGVTNSTGGPWALTPLTRMLRNPRLIGKKLLQVEGHGPLWVPTKAPAVLTAAADVDAWWRIHAELTDPARRAQARPDAQKLGDGYFRCGVCGNKLVYRAPVSGRAPRWSCHTEGGGHVSIRADIADDALEHAVVARAGEVVPGITEVSAAAWWGRRDVDARRELVDGLLDAASVHPMVPGEPRRERVRFAWKKDPAWPKSLASAK